MDSLSHPMGEGWGEGPARILAECTFVFQRPLISTLSVPFTSVLLFLHEDGHEVQRFEVLFLVGHFNAAGEPDAAADRGKPLLRKGGALILCHPCYDQFDHVQHPSYIEFFNRLLPETRDAEVLRHKYEEEFARNPSYIEMYRRGNAYHGADPCFMWYWGQRGREKASRVIVVGADNATVPQIMAWETAGSIAEAIAMARGTMGRSAQITMLHHPPYMISDVM